MKKDENENNGIVESENIEIKTDPNNKKEEKETQRKLNYPPKKKKKNTEKKKKIKIDK